MKTKQDAMTDLAEPLRRFVRKRVNHSHDADDIVQDVMLKALANVQSIPPDERLAAWMFRTARNAIIDRYRSRKSQSLADEPADDRDDTDESNVVNELASCLRCMVDRMDAPYAEALNLADVQGQSQQQIADRMNISLSGAKSRVQRARQQLQSMFAACCDLQRDVRGNVTDFHPNDRTRQSCADRGCDPEANPCR
jgi:RNA polymerase sigma-70 factor, ECF subfamily